MGFDFRLKRVLKLRELKQEQSAAKLGVSIQILTKEEARKDKLEKEYINTDHSIESAADMQVQAVRRDWLRESLISQAEAIEQAREAVELAAQAYTDDAKDTKVLENLKEKQLEDYKMDMLREDRKLMNEVALRRDKE